MSKVKKIQLPSGTQLDLGAGYDWIGTKAQYDTAWAAGEIESDWVCIITDDAMDHATKANIDLDNLSDKGSKMMDGQWVAKTATLSTATAVGTYTIDLSSYLPNDNYNYEIMLLDQMNSETYNNNSWRHIKINEIFVCHLNVNNVYTTQYQYDSNTFIGVCRYNIPIILSVELQNCGSAQLYALGYHRVGTNN